MEIVAEEWRTVEGYEGCYEVSNQGRVRSIDKVVRTNGGRFATKRGKIRRSVMGKAGYYLVTLCDACKTKTFLVHRLVATAFVPACADRPHVNHINGIKTDNRPENLEWVTPKENKRHASELGLTPSGERQGNAKLTWDRVKEIRRIYIETGAKQRDLAKQFGISQPTVAQVVQWKTWKLPA